MICLNFCQKKMRKRWTGWCLIVWRCDHKEYYGKNSKKLAMMHTMVILSIMVIMIIMNIKVQKMILRTGLIKSFSGYQLHLPTQALKICPLSLSRILPCYPLPFHAILSHSSRLPCYVFAWQINSSLLNFNLFPQCFWFLFCSNVSSDSPHLLFWASPVTTFSVCLFREIAQRGKHKDLRPFLWPLITEQINPMRNLKINHFKISYLPHQSNQNEMMPKSSDLSLKITSLSPSQKCHTSHQHSTNKINIFLIFNWYSINCQLLSMFSKYSIKQCHLQKYQASHQDSARKSWLQSVCLNFQIPLIHTRPHTAQI